MWMSLVIGFVTAALIIYYVWFRVSKGHQVLPRITDPNKPRFRKRDKVLFYGRKMIRRVRSLTKPEGAGPSGRRFSVAASSSKRKQLEVMKIAKKLLRIKKETEPQLKHQEPPAAFFEADWHDDLSEYKLPAEVMYMLKSVRVLGHFEKPIFLELCRYMESRFVPVGTHLFRIGDPDDSIFVIQSGKVTVYIKDSDGKEHVVKEVSTGENIHSLLSILDVLTGHPAPFKTVSAVATVNTTILRLPAKAFQIVLERFPESLVRVVQIIMVRLQRVTFTALHNYLGLTYELMNPQAEYVTDKQLSIHSIALSSSGSPLRVSRSHSKQSVTSTASETLGGSVVDEGDIDGLKRSSSAENAGGVATMATSASIPMETKRPPVAGSSGRSRETVGSSSAGNSKPSVLSQGESLEQSDFEAACTTARVGGSSVIDDPIVCGTPPVKSTLDEDLFFPPSSTPQVAGSPGKKPSKRVVLADQAQYIPPANTPDRKSVSIQEVDTQLNDEEILKMAMSDIATLLDLQSPELLQGRCYLRYLKTGTTLTRQGDQDACLYFVVAGQLHVSQLGVGQNHEQASLFIVQPGELVGSLAVLTGEPSFFKIKSRVESMIIIISKQDFYEMMKEQPRIVLNVGHTVVRRMSPFVRQIDFALDWMYIEAGRSLFRQNETSDNVYIVLNGRLRSVVQLKSGKKDLVAEYGRGELVGIVEVLTQTNRATSVIAIRDTELATVPDPLLNVVKRKFPQIVTRLIHLLGQRILGSLTKGPARSLSVTGSGSMTDHHSKEMKPTVANLNTVAILPVSDDVPLSNFTLELQHSLNAIGQTLRLTSEIIQNRLGAKALEPLNEYRLSSWLGQQEDIHRMVLYQCDYRMTPWTQRCIRQADCILIVCLAVGEPRVGEIETEMEHLAVRAQKELILLHHDDARHPRNTVAWLNARGWCSSHHHIRCPKRVFSKRSKTRMPPMKDDELWNQIYRNLFETEPDRMSDFSRLARVLTGTAIGLVLGGGGARGISQVGIMRCLVESGIPIDIVGGTSIGSFMGALWADETDIVRVTQRAREWAMDFKSTWKKILDLTYPVTAMFSGASFNHSIKSVFKDRQIEDLWIPYFSITTDITASSARIHTSGSLWRYVRSSMSLSGYLPPLCDPTDGHMLLDGGYVNNLPVDVIKSMGAQNIFAVDVGAQDETDFTNFGDELSGWWLLWKRWNPWAKAVKIPNMAEVQSRLAYVSCVKMLESVKDSGDCEYIRPPIDKYGTLQFGSFDEIYDVGYAHGKALFSAWVKRGLVKELFAEKKEDSDKPAHQIDKQDVPVEANFTDLAELISRIDEPRFPFAEGVNSDPDDEDEDDSFSVTSEPGAPASKPRLNYKRKNSMIHNYRAVSEGGSPADSAASSPEDQFQMPPEFSDRDLNDMSTDDTDDDFTPDER